MNRTFLYFMLLITLFHAWGLTAMGWFKKKETPSTIIYPSYITICSSFIDDQTLWIPLKNDQHKSISTTNGTNAFVHLRDTELMPLWKTMIQLGWQHKKLHIDEHDNPLLNLSVFDRYPALLPALGAAAAAGTIGYWIGTWKHHH